MRMCVLGGRGVSPLSMPLAHENETFLLTKLCEQCMTQQKGTRSDLDRDHTDRQAPMRMCECVGGGSVHCPCLESDRMVTLLLSSRPSKRLAELTTHKTLGTPTTVVLLSHSGYGSFFGCLFSSITDVHVGREMSRNCYGGT